MTEKIRQCPNTLCKLPMGLLMFQKKPHEFYCTECGTSIDRQGKPHHKRHVERYMAQGFVDDETGYVTTKEGKDVN